MASDDDQDSSTGQNGLSVTEQEERIQNLVPALPVEEWGRKPVVNPAPSAAEASSSSAESKPVKQVQNNKPGTINDVSPKMRPPIFAKQDFDGYVSDSDDDSEDEILPPPGTLGRKIAEMRWSEGAPKIEEIDEEPSRKQKLGLGDDIDEQMRRRVWGEQDERRGTGQMEMEIDPDMGEEEEDFLKFSRDALGISDDIWEAILSSRRDRGSKYRPNYFDGNQS